MFLQDLLDTISINEYIRISDFESDRLLWEGKRKDLPKSGEVERHKVRILLLTHLHTLDKPDGLEIFI